jgi:hypothetical protein
MRRLLALVVASCSEEPAPCVTTSDCAAGVCTSAKCVAGGGDAGTGDAGLDLPDSQPSVDLASVEISPPSAELTSTDGSRPTVDFEVTGVFTDGSRGPVSGAAFSIDSNTIGIVDEASGRFMANGTAGGRATVTVTVPAVGSDLTATASIRVLLERVIIAPGAPSDAADIFATAPIFDPSRAAGVVYPLEGAVMPENVFPATIQWLNGEPGDLFAVELAKPSARVVAFLPYDGTNAYLADLRGWRSIARTEPSEDAMVTVLRRHGASGQVVDSPSVPIRFVPVSLSGSVYFWDIGQRRILRVDDGDNRAVSFMPNPPNPAPDVPGGPIPENCVGCHSISKSGRYMAGRLGPGNNIGGVFDLTLDLTQQPVPTAFPVVSDPPSVKWWFSSWSPDDIRVVVSSLEATPDATLRFLDPFSGTFVDPASGAMPIGGVTHPSWSPDGSAIAYIANADSWGGVNSTGDVGIVPVLGPDVVGAPIVVHAGADLAGAIPNGIADSYPTWSPDSRWIAFAHGTSSRSENGLAALYLMGRDGSSVVRLDRASGGPSAGDTYQPNFSPFHAGGYFWLSYLSKRDYGNSVAGTRGAARQQIWVSAVRDSPSGSDPSEVGYWLPGQNVASQNISGFWAPRPCRQDGAGCEVGSSCCSGDCRPDGSGALVCSPQIEGVCRELGQPCSVDGDCCESLVCIGTTCSSL